MHECKRHPGLSREQLLRSADTCTGCLQWLGFLNFQSAGYQPAGLQPAGIPDSPTVEMEPIEEELPQISMEVPLKRKPGRPTNASKLAQTEALAARLTSRLRAAPGPGRTVPGPAVPAPPPVAPKLHVAAPRPPVALPRLPVVTQTHPPKDGTDFEHLYPSPSGQARFRIGQEVFVLTFSYEKSFGVHSETFTVVEGPLRWQGEVVRWVSYKVQASNGEVRIFFECNLHASKKDALEDIGIRNSVLENVKRQS